MNTDNTPQQSPKSVASTQTSPSRYSKATHLTEFYPYLNGGSQTTQSPSINNNDKGHSSQSSVLLSHSQRRPSLSTVHTYNSFSPSTLDLQTLVTKTDISKTTEAYNQILEASEEYRKALLHVAEAAGNFGAALEMGAKCKGSGNAADGLLSASGLYFLVANHQQILAHSVKESFELPVSQEINKFKLTAAKNDEIFKNNIKEKITNLKKQERENMKMSKLKSRNLVTYKSKLLQLTTHIDEIDRAKHDYYQSAFDIVQDTSFNILNQVGSIVRAQVEIYEGIARKGWSGGGLDELIAGCPDPFTNEEDEEEENPDEGDTEEVEVDDDTIEPIPNLKPQSLTSNENGLIFNRQTSTPQPVLSHSQSLRSFERSLNQHEMIQASTPKDSPSNPPLDDTVDDNSFSLPLPGSSSRSNVKKEDDPKTEVIIESSQPLRNEIYHAHSEWRDSDHENEDELHKVDSVLANTSITT